MQFIKKFKKGLSMLLLLILCLSFLPMKVWADPYGSFVLDKDGHFRLSPSLYTPVSALEYDFDGVEDIFIDSEDWIYVARTGGLMAEVVIFDENEQFVRSIGEDVLMSATGVFVAEPEAGKRIYVVDNMAATIYVFNIAGDLLDTFGRPTSPLFGADTIFRPQKIAVDRQGNMNIISEGNVNGVIQLSPTGEFLGFFGASITDANIIRRIQRALFTEQIMATFIRNIPQSMNNIAIDDRGIVYATTSGETNEALKKINIAGRNLFPNLFPIGWLDGDNVNLIATDVDSSGNVYALSGTTGLIFILDSQGRFIGIFGRSSTLPSELGVTSSPVGIAVNSQRRIFIADRGNGNVVSFMPTPLMESLFVAVDYYAGGFFIEGEHLWRDVVSRNAMIALAYDAIGMSRIQQQDYAGALYYFRLSNNRDLYSNAFWELRQQVIFQFAGPVLLGLIIFLFVAGILNKVDKHTGMMDFYRDFKDRSGNTKLGKEWRAVTMVFRRPDDAFYNIRAVDAISPISAIILFSMTVGLVIAGAYLNGFIFNEVNTASLFFFNPLREVVNYTVLGGLFVIANLLVSSIRDGRGKFRHILKGTALALAPIAFLYGPYIILTNLLSAQEIFLLQLLLFVMIAWSVVLLVIMQIEIHEYDTKDALKTLFLTIVVMIILFIVGIVIYMLAMEGLAFFWEIIEEAVRNVF